MIYFTSDLHLNHNKEFIYIPRGFDNVWDMNRAIVENWNAIVKPDDDVFVLGDLMLGGDMLTQDSLNLIKSLKGKIHIVLGNHDTDNRIELYKSLYNVVSICYALRLKYDGYTFFLCHFPVLCSNIDDKGLKHRTICLCGHTHTKNRFVDMDKGYIYHVEVDAHDMKPVSIEEVIKDISKFKFVRFSER